MKEYPIYKGFRPTDKPDFVSKPEKMAADNEPKFGFDEAADRLRPGAEKIIENGRWVSVLNDWEQQNNLTDHEVDEDTCSKFIKEHPSFPYEPAMVKAIIDISRKGRRESH